MKNLLIIKYSIMTNLDYVLIKDEEAQTLHIEVRGALKAADAIDFKTHLVSIVNNLNPIVDLSELEDIDLAGINALVCIHNRAKERSKQATYHIAENSAVDRILKVTKLGESLSCKIRA